MTVLEIRVLCLAVLLVAAPAWAGGRAEVDYMVHCQGCHLPDGSGFPARGVPDMRDVLVPFSQFGDGRAYLVQVPGSRLSALPDERLTDVLNWILEELASGEDSFVPYTAQEVARLRAEPLDDAAAMRARLIQQIATSADPE